MASRRHIIYLNEFFHPDICASAVVATTQVRRIARLRPEWRFTVVAGNRAWDDPAALYPAEDTIDGVRIVRVERPALQRANLLRRLMGFAAFGQNAVRAARGVERADLVIGTTAPPHGGSIAAKIAAAHGCPFVYKVLDLYPDLAATLGRTSAGGLIYRCWLAKDTRVMRRAARVVCVTEPMRERILRTRHIESAKVCTIHDGFDPAVLAFEGRNEFADQFNPEGRFVVQYAGNMGLSHPFETILSAARELADQPDILLQFIGDGPHRARIAANLPPNARLIAYQPAKRLGMMLAAADVCLISQHERMFDQAIPYKVYASLAAGKPIVFVGSSRSEIAGWLRETRAGVQVEQGDVPGLVREVLELKRAATEARSEAGRAARGLEHRFGADRVSDAWTSLIDAVMARSSV